MYFELKHHGPQLKRIIDDQHARLDEAQQKISRVEAKQPMLDERIDHAVQRHNSLEQRLQRLRRLPGAHKKPLSRAEREFKSELGNLFHTHHNDFYFIRSMSINHLTSFNDLFGHYSDQFTGVELDALRSSIDTLRARLKRYTKSSKDNVTTQRRKIPGRNHAQDAQISQLKSSLEKLSLLNSESTKKVELVESAIKTVESSRNKTILS